MGFCRASLWLVTVVFLRVCGMTIGLHAFPLTDCNSEPSSNRPGTKGDSYRTSSHLLRLIFTNVIGILEGCMGCQRQSRFYC